MNERQDELLSTLERLLELPTSTVHFLLDQAVQQAQKALAADLVALFFHDPSTDTLIARHVSDTPMGRQLRAIGMNRLPLANSGSAVEVFLSGVPFLTGHADQIPSEPPGFITALGVKSQMIVVFRVQTRHRGVLLAASTTPGFFSANDPHFLEALARWVGLVLGRNELVEQMQQRTIAHDHTHAAEELLTIMTHDLRNYLQPLHGRLDLLLERAKREQREKDIRDVESSLHTLHLLNQGISDIIDIAHLNQGMFALTPVSMNLKEVVQNVANDFASSRRIPLSVRSPQEIIITADPQRIRQALETMLSYILNSSSKPTEITVDISIENRSEDPWVQLCIKSAGSTPPAIPESHLPALVASSHSTQLGVHLYLTDQIALAHHGTFSVDSTTDQGCSLTFSFPVEEEALLVRGEDEVHIML